MSVWPEEKQQEASKCQVPIRGGRVVYSNGSCTQTGRVLGPSEQAAACKQADECMGQADQCSGAGEQCRRLRRRGHAQCSAQDANLAGATDNG
jgi:hypothetical protein